MKDEQQRYASYLHWSTLAGFVVLILTFLGYVSGVLAPMVPLHEMPKLWGLPTEEYLRQTGLPTGWSWLGLIQHGDLASLLGIALLSGCSILCILAVMPLFAARRDKAYLFLCTLEIAVLLLSASGVMTMGK